MATITATDVKALRDRTGAGMMDCKSALTEANGDMDEAITILRKKGMAQVAKKAGRAMKEGLVGVRLNADATDGVVAEVNCETDFVARTPEFQALVETVTAAARRALDRGSAGARRRRRRGRPEGRREDRQDRREHGRHARRAPHRRGPRRQLPAPGRQDRRAGRDPGRARRGARSDAVQTLVRELAMQIAAASPSYATRTKCRPPSSSRRRTSTAPRWRTAASRRT